MTTSARPDPTTGDLGTGAHDELRNLLLTGDLVVGDVLKEVELAARLGISRTPIREALHRLDTEGVVQRRGRSYVVAGLDPTEEAAIGQVRGVLEPLAASLAAEAVAAGLAAPVELERLRASTAELRQAAVDGDPGRAAAANHRFHRDLAVMGRNPVLATHIIGLNDRIAIATLLRLRSASWAEEAAGQHEHIIEAIAAGDADAARSAAQAHVAAVADA